MLCITNITSVLACDVCGGGAAMSGLGFLPNSDFHFVGLTYRLRTYSTEHPKLFDSDPIVKGSNLFQTTELWSRYTVNNRVQLLGFFPLHSKQLDDESLPKAQNNFGLGDISLVTNYQIIKNDNLRWFLGAGLKLPTGESNHKIDGDIIPNMQLGTGSTDLLFTSNLTLFRKQRGLNAELNYSLNTLNKRYYRYGNTLDFSALGFAQLSRGGLMYIPQIGVNYLHIQKDQINAITQKTEFYSGVSLLSVPIGLDIYKGNFGLRTKCNIPVRGTLSEGYVIPEVNVQAQLIYIINSSKKNDESEK